MPVAGSGGRKPPKVKDPIVKGPRPGTTLQSGSSTTTSSATSDSSSGSKGGAVLGGGKSSSTGSSSSSSSSSSSASSDYLKSQKEAARKARNRYLEDAERLTGQVRALRAALGNDGAFKRALRGRLGNIDRTLDEQIAEARAGFDERWGSLKADEDNNLTAAADSTVENEGNRARERTMALGEAASQGAGESDQLAAQLMSLRNWDANQQEVNRSYTDSARSIASSRIDLVNDTRTAMQNMALEADSDRQQLWDDFWQQKSETQVALGNALGQQAEYLGLAKEQGAKRVNTSILSMGGSRGGRGGGQPGRLGDWGVGTTGQGTDFSESEKDQDRLGSMFTRTVDDGGSAGGTKPLKGKGRNDTKSKGGKGGTGNKRIDQTMSELEAQSDAAFMAGTKAMGKSYDAKGVPEWLKGWGPDIPEPQTLASSNLSAARTTVAQKRPEGATLRKW